MKLEDIICYLEKRPTILDKEENYLILEKIAQINVEEILSDFETFSCIMSDIEYSFQESFDWMNSEKEPRKFISFLRDVEVQLLEPKYKSEINHLIDFFAWSKW